ncbi:hypothetical protein [Neobacillus mesonae]|uniref:hypothetical protein n=1 Tax=Neobacillus mesonae TaxID=1193713 RepID=UPI00203AEB62|nr:hypothetical protein [Neobacillus mesonae]MCM3568644.1 hypothetical protein [Neobacillus mesonae]
MFLKNVEKAPAPVAAKLIELLDRWGSGGIRNSVKKLMDLKGLVKSKHNEDHFNEVKEPESPNISKSNLTYDEVINFLTEKKSDKQQYEEFKAEYDKLKEKLNSLIEFVSNLQKK